MAVVDERSALTPSASGKSGGSWGFRLSPYLYVLPFFGLFAVFGLFPLLYTAFVSLHSVDLQTPDVMTGFGVANYGKLLHDPYFWKALVNTMTLGLLACGPQLVFAVGIAHLLNYQLKGRTVWRVAVLLPYATSVAAATLVFAQLFGDHGLVNWLLGAMHLPKVDWQSGTLSSQLAIASIVTWRWTGYNALIYLAAMQTISFDLYEAAALDGASKFRQFTAVTLPGIRPTIIFTIIISTIGASQLFIEPLLYQGGSIGVQGGVSRQYQTLTLYMYQQGWSFFHLGYAAAIAFAILLLIIILVAINGLVANKRLAGDS